MAAFAPLGMMTMLTSSFITHTPDSFLHIFFVDYWYTTARTMDFTKLLEPVKNAICMEFVGTFHPMEDTIIFMVFSKANTTTWNHVATGLVADIFC
jgi:hypothetical protein